MEGVMENWTNAKLCDVANLILGAILFFSPWIFGFDAGKASDNAHIAGIVIAVLAVAAPAAFAIWEEWPHLPRRLWPPRSRLLRASLRLTTPLTVPFPHRT